MRPRSFRGAAMAAAILLPTAACPATIIVDYVANAGGNNPNPINGLAAQATWRADGATLTIMLENTSIGVPIDATAADSLLVSLAFNLGDGISITSGNHAVIGAGSTGIGAVTRSLSTATPTPTPAGPTAASPPIRPCSPSSAPSMQ